MYHTYPLYKIIKVNTRRFLKNKRINYKKKYVMKY